MFVLLDPPCVPKNKNRMYHSLENFVKLGQSINVPLLSDRILSIFLFIEAYIYFIYPSFLQPSFGLFYIL